MASFMEYKIKYIKSLIYNQVNIDNIEKYEIYSCDKFEKVLILPPQQPIDCFLYLCLFLGHMHDIN